ncbi:MAG TPA: adenylyltransferase/cytidyltransferase family protein [Candidatus Baltobacteraceae bacterium]|nr:adenylyltransferase/cytidyltransferase family protein [Candidatus Baltobacteraceae bacterium]
MVRKLVMAFGSFDIIHPGHLVYLKKAKAMGDRLIVVVARDSSIEMIKGRKPFFDQKTRLNMVGALRYVDKAVLGKKIADYKDRYSILLDYKPDVIVFGYDQRVDPKDVKQWAAKRGLKVRVVRAKQALNRGVYKSSKIRALLSSI